MLPDARRSLWISTTSTNTIITILHTNLSFSFVRPEQIPETIHITQIHAQQAYSRGLVDLSHSLIGVQLISSWHFGCR